MGKILDGITFSDLRPDVDPVKAIKLIQLVMDGFSRTISGERPCLPRLDEEVAEFTEYMDILERLEAWLDRHR